MRNKNHFIELHNKVDRLEKDYANFEAIIDIHDKLFERFFDFDKAVHTCEGEDMEIFASLKKIILYELERITELYENLDFNYTRMNITKEEEVYFKKLKTLSKKITTKKKLIEKASSPNLF